MSILHASGLRKSYKHRAVVNDVAIDLAQGEIVGLLGPNGAGKTTCFYMISGLIQADAGTIEVDGTDVTRLPMYRRARLGIGYLPQEASIFRGLTAEQNIRAAAELIEPDANRLNAMVARVAATYPDRVHHINLTGTLAAHYGSADNYKLLWANELHPNEQGFDILGTQIANKLKAIGIQGANPNRSDRTDANDETDSKREVSASLS